MSETKGKIEQWKELGVVAVYAAATTCHNGSQWDPVPFVIVPSISGGTTLGTTQDVCNVILNSLSQR
jgi:hypothetical protein